MTGERAQSASGGAVELRLPHQNSSITIASSVFVGNTANPCGVARPPDVASGDCSGGAVAIESTGRVALMESRFESNYCMSGESEFSPIGSV